MAGIIGRSLRLETAQVGIVEKQVDILIRLFPGRLFLSGNEPIVNQCDLNFERGMIKCMRKFRKYGTRK